MNKQCLTEIFLETVIARQHAHAMRATVIGYVHWCGFQSIFLPI